MRSSIVVLLCVSATSVSACDKSWRDENFQIPKLGEQGSGVEKPRPTAPGSHSAEDIPNPPRNSGEDGGAGDASGVLEEDASVGSAVPDASNQQTTDTTDNPDEPGSAVEDFSKHKLLTAVAECALTQYSEFAQSAKELAQAVNQLPEIPTDTDFLKVQPVFVEAMKNFQVIEQFRLGPAARAMDPGGQDLRDWIYSYPQVNRCQIDRNLVSEVYAADPSAILLNARGLAALEYLLFSRSDDNVCSAGIDINSGGGWSAMSKTELDSRRAKYAKVVASDVEARSRALRDAWHPDGGNFQKELTDAGEDSEVFDSEQAALNAVSHALFYIEKEVKDYKLGWPLGLVAECISGHCPGASESPYAQVSASNIGSNVRGFRLLFEGCGENYQGLGFDDWLRAVHPEGDLDQRMLAGLRHTEQALAQLSRPLEDAFYDAPAEALAIHTAVKEVTDLLKTEFVTVLNLDLPMTAEGDND